jgi:hypothetical protein
MAHVTLFSLSYLKKKRNDLKMSLAFLGVDHDAVLDVYCEPAECEAEDEDDLEAADQKTGSEAQISSWTISRMIEKQPSRRLKLVLMLNKLTKLLLMNSPRFLILVKTRIWTFPMFREMSRKLEILIS